MNTYLLTWNPHRWNWQPDALQALLYDIEQQGFGVQRWSCGHNKGIEAGDRVFLLRQGQKPRGIIGSGWVSDGSYEAAHYVPEKAAQGHTACFVGVRFEVLLSKDAPEDVFPRQRLDALMFSGTHWNTQSSGITIDKASAVHSDWVDTPQLAAAWKVVGAMTGA
jgi:hypothetical protein